MEFKRMVAPADQEKPRRHPLINRPAIGKPKQNNLIASYFDTPDCHIRRHGAGLRIREVDGAAENRAKRSAQSLEEIPLAEDAIRCMTTTTPWI